MKKMIKLATLSILVAAPALYGAGITACVGCHGQQFEKAAMGKSKIVKDMSKEEIVAALKGYKAGNYGGAMKAMMVGQVASLDDAGIDSIAAAIKGGGATTSTAPVAAPAAKMVDINQKASDAGRIKKEDLSSKKNMTEESLGLRKTDLYSEKNTEGTKTDYSRPAPGTSARFERAYVNAPPMIPHDVEGMTEITKENNQCIGCHMPEVASGVGATAIPKSHFTNFRPNATMQGNEVMMGGKVLGAELGNTSDIKTVTETKDKLYQGRFNCTACHAPQAKVETIVANTFTPDFGNTEEKKGKSNLLDVVNEGVE